MTGLTNLGKVINFLENNGPTFVLNGTSNGNPLCALFKNSEK